MATPQQMLEIVAGALGAQHAAPLQVSDPALPWIVPAERLSAICTALRDEPRLAMASLMNLTAVDRKADGVIEIVYHLSSMAHHHVVTLKVKVDRDAAAVPSVAAIWPAADWFEREVYDLFGVRFDGHPDLRRILCPDDWVGHPLRKDYVKASQDIPVVKRKDLA